MKDHFDMENNNDLAAFFMKKQDFTNAAPAFYKEQKDSIEEWKRNEWAPKTPTGQSSI